MSNIGDGSLLVLTEYDREFVYFLRILIGIPFYVRIRVCQLIIKRDTSFDNSGGLRHLSIVFKDEGREL